MKKLLQLQNLIMPKENLKHARAEYINALRFKPNQPDVIAKINEINLKLGITTEAPKADTTYQLTAKAES